AYKIVLDGIFGEWDGLAHITDPAGDGGVGGDVMVFYWATNPGESNLYFMVERAFPGYNPVSVSYQQNFDINNNGSYTDSVDRYAVITYSPTRSKGYVQVRVYRADGTLIAGYGGNWGEGTNKGQNYCEYYVTMTYLGIDPGQTIRMYLSSQAMPSDRCPDTGDIQWSPVPFMGPAGLAALLILSATLIVIFLKKKGEKGWLS
ncbi:MAG: hypothetical protein AB1556_15485, partial [Bacillota bacterium]